MFRILVWIWLKDDHKTAWEFLIKYLLGSTRAMEIFGDLWLLRLARNYGNWALHISQANMWPISFTIIDNHQNVVLVYLLWDKCLDIWEVNSGVLNVSLKFLRIKSFSQTSPALNEIEIVSKTLKNSKKYSTFWHTSWQNETSMKRKPIFQKIFSISQ